MVQAMPVPPAIEAFVRRVSAGDGNAAAEWVHDDAEFQLPGNQVLPIGSAGAQAFASRHGEVEDRLISVELQCAEAVRENVWLTRLVFVNREIASGETMYEMEVGGVFELRGGRIARLRAFASPEEARAAGVGGADR
jgi:ketosteroid isomerase-like protein